ncbi:Alg9-like mannosyltransferase family-domain-containing protein [Obelidium mucronatum]|nr:Alg9-like mannosyltransferase family-domain-containing protein [Obelidium mucronatum]
MTKEKIENTKDKEEEKPQPVSLFSAKVLTDDSTNINHHDLIAILPGALYDLLILMFMIHAVLLAPYTKVEESFNVQAVHDLMLLPVSQLNEYDHMSFPGVVPRTFIGPLFIKLISQPAIAVLTGDGKSELTSDWYLYIARITLTILTVHSLRILRLSIARVFGYTVSAFFALVCLSQFHLVFWGSRLIPNTFALILVNYGVSSWIASWKPVTRKEIVDQFRERERIFGSPPTSLAEGRTRKIPTLKKQLAEPPISSHAAGLIVFILFAAIVFRMELLALLGPILLSEIFIYKHLKFFPVLLTCILTGIVSLALTLSIDTIFWNTTTTKDTLMWPELEVFKFNVLEGRSKEYGVSPAHFYFSNLIPRIATVAYPLAVFAYIKDPRVRRIMNPVIIFLTTMSLIGHKEWRFIFPILPLINLSAAITLTRIHRLGFLTPATRPPNTIGTPSFLHTLLALLLPCLLLASFVFANIATEISSLNYPGGVAMKAIHQFIPPSSTTDVSVKVHMDVYTCQTGASRFMELGRPVGWEYSKVEGLVKGSEFVERGFTHLLTTTPEVHVGEGWDNDDNDKNQAKSGDSVGGYGETSAGTGDGLKMWDVVPGYIHALKGVKVVFGPGGWKAWVAESVEKVMRGDLKWIPKKFVYGIKLPIEVQMEPKIYLLERKGWKKSA